MNGNLYLNMMQNTHELACSAQIVSGRDPINEKEADASPEAEEWLNAKIIELEGLDKLNCWEYIDECDMPPGSKIFHGKFVFKRKAPANCIRKTQHPV